MTEHYDTVVVGGGQAGLATGYYLRQHDRDFVVLDAGGRVGDPWRNRWDSLRVFTPARYTGLPGMGFPTSPYYFPTKDEVADYLEAYADRFDLPVELGVRVRALERTDDGYRITADDRRIEARNVVVAMASYQVPVVPDFAADLADDVVQLHSTDYRNPGQLRDGGVLVVGAGNSGAEIALEVAEHHETWLSGRDVGHVPFHVDSRFGRHLGVPFVLRVLYHRVLTTGTPVGRRVRPKVLGRGGPVVRTKPADLSSAGVERVARTTGVRDGLPIVGDDRTLDVANVVWCTGFRPDFSWIDLPIFDGQDAPAEPVHVRGVVPDAPGLYFVGLLFLYALTSSLFTGVGRDARYVVKQLTARDERGGGQTEASVTASREADSSGVKQG
ncbi:FAD-dependent pyridine nucleotide-disulfide oxidoreductase [Halogeometricum pallidum JCM 14848]|uniref:FAD-dependent pyridine nucleotide-disulfide oxidoreductase n=1 Tax=Halogeometricum pallidum JCM 14848 TaxID=1227487 RepID=M0CXF5_HALPD|nr:NAD(P)-binding domain-containing protein [Halogeometricum pallidum]ELZ27117.1 FAD-dependent pyridine nucleotide-disulfide oxidoreductase [Halogeometricum pallidum JCM 14848]